ncbi:CPBP family intramembrane metalloprotease [Endozoicomonas sp. G2_1]|uniref:CPBP family intramembrane glutamic endopeptidase n=1 Tax=Endozoicomonas sp. G2_1 TaxID=2821091 RepID=UPI001ADC1BD8|nr:CPBP family intramembrane glutamic endopeptidase [Endozoicomonas sp. G2_1]MBO9491863.1 CPBP family intramembrane metalloprotease [Endozoicomonas sp. G2_1]
MHDELGLGTEKAKIGELMSVQHMWNKALVAELFFLFLLMPITLLLPIAIIWQVLAVAAAAFYVLYVMKGQGLLIKARLLSANWRELPNRVLLRFSLFIAISTALMTTLMPEKLFYAVLGNPTLWLAISAFYIIFSVYPQELLYRLFFFHRYQPLFSDKRFLLFFNAIIFCYAHLVYLDTLVFALTFVGGVIFANTYQRTKSVMFTSVEHALYGWWLYTLGLGEMLAFPGP